ncbi:hypothetical protein ACKVEX_15740 [Rhodocyclaceae bacterium SMB388]
MLARIVAHRLHSGKIRRDRHRPPIQVQVKVMSQHWKLLDTVGMSV